MAFFLFIIVPSLIVITVGFLYLCLPMMRKKE